MKKHYYGYHSSAFGLSGSSPGISDADSVIAEIPRAGFEDDQVSSTAIRAKIASHPLYPKLLQAHIDCHKVDN